MEVAQKTYICYYWKTYNMKEVIVRTLSGVLYISIVILSMFTSREWFMGLFFILGVITLHEFLKLVHLSGIRSYVSYLLLAVALFFFSYKFDDFIIFLAFSVYQIIAIYLLLIIGGLVNLFLLIDVLWSRKIPVFKNKKYIPVIFYIISGFVFLTLIPFQNGDFEPKILVGIFILIWSNDTFAYLIGSNFGKTKLLERVSPNKTVEGFLGGLLGSLLAGFIIFKTIDYLNLWQWLCLAIIATVFGTIGDLIQSKFKRQAGVKDSGALMPGHGGLYDRLDSVIYSSPFIYAFLLIVDHVS